MALVFQRKLFISTTNSISTIGSFRKLTSRELIFRKFGDPLFVMEMTERELPKKLDHDEVLVRMLAAPVNPVDINIIQGRYPLKPALPHVGGNEGVGVVEGVGKGVRRMAAGHVVVITEPGHGSWRTLGIFSKNQLRVIPHYMGLAEAATLTTNPCTAYRMLTDFQPVRQNNNLVVIQNGANSAVGQNVIQLCKIWGIKTVNVVRDRPDIVKLKEYLCCLGATYVFTETELKKTTIFSNKLLPRPVLALNCVGGKNAMSLMKHMNRSGIMVTYGGMSRQPVTIPTSALIFQNLSFYGFWMTKWEATAKESEKDEMFAELNHLICENRLLAPLHKMVLFDSYREAIGNTLTSTGFAGYKYIMDFRCNY